MKGVHGQASGDSDNGSPPSGGWSHPAFEALVEAIGHPIAVVDEFLRIEACNRSFRDTFGLSEGTWCLAPLLEAVHDPRVEDAVKRGASSAEGAREVELSCRTGDAEERHFLLSSSKISWPSLGDRVFIMFDEVTEWKQRQSQVMEASRLVAVGEMVSGLAHEINNPMAAVMGFSQLILRRDLEPEVRRDVEKILGEAEKCAGIVSNLQSFARHERGVKRLVDAIQILSRAIDFRTYQLEASKIEVVTVFESPDAKVLADEHQLAKAFLNIMANAEESMVGRQGGGRLIIEVSTRNGKVSISFADDGPGIAEQLLSKVFDPFFTTKEVGRGTGLGLSFCFGVVRNHGGAITVDSTPGKGAKFTIELPSVET